MVGGKPLSRAHLAKGNFPGREGGPGQGRGGQKGAPGERIPRSGNADERSLGILRRLHSHLASSAELREGEGVVGVGLRGYPLRGAPLSAQECMLAEREPRRLVRLGNGGPSRPSSFAPLLRRGEVGTPKSSPADRGRGVPL